MSNIYVNCGGSLMKFNNKKDTMDFFEDCIYSSEGSERNRYTTIYFEVKEHFNDNQICFTDGTDHVYDSNINPEDVSHDEEKQLRKYFNIDKVDLLRFKADNHLAKRNNKIYQSTLNRYEDIDDLYNDYISKSNEVSFYYFDEHNQIICIDATACPPDNYWVEEFPLEDYEYADSWLGQELEYDDYLEHKKSDYMELD
ncbi:hypothetical protein [uncultured Clostridium sp.]|uniref:hypothetical protein n=1 Tax=uncultured Clostridium sp. TaxID=59620 RepID=UPI002614E3B6|nr:hypothetical protein [uncultured Clostridium sp.]